MPIINMPSSEERAIEFLKGRMGYYSYGSPEYEICRESFKFFANRYLGKIRSDEQNIKNNISPADEGSV